MSDLNCPYCGHDQDVNHDDGFGYDEGKKHEMQCYECDKHFIFETEIYFDYVPEKAECLNGGKHDIVEKVRETSFETITHIHCTTCDGMKKTTWVDKKPKEDENDENK